VGLQAGLAESEGFEPTLFAGTLGPGEGDMRYAALEAGVEVVTVPGLGPDPKGLDDLRALWWLYRRFRRDRPHVVHTHTARAGAVGRVAAVLARVPLRVHTYHGHVLGGDYFAAPRTAFFRFIERTLGRFTHRLIVLSPQQRTDLSETLRIAEPGRFVCVPLGLDLDRFRTMDREEAGREARQALGVPQDTWVIGTMGRLVAVKNHELLLRAFASAAARTRAEGGSARLLIAGDGEPARKDALRQLAQDLGIGDLVTWLGWRRDLPELLAAMDCFALTSRDEGTPVAVIEALCAGTIVVARSVGGVADLLGDLPTAIPVETDDVDAFADALLRSRALAIGAERWAAVRAQTAERFDLDRLTRDISDVYVSALEETGTPG